MTVFCSVCGTLLHGGVCPRCEPPSAWNLRLQTRVAQAKQVLETFDGREFTSAEFIASAKKMLPAGVNWNGFWQHVGAHLERYNLERIGRYRYRRKPKEAGISQW